MPTCKYCGQETGGAQFCQTCGAKVEAEPVAPSPIPTMNQQMPYQQPPMGQPYPQYYQPQQMYTPGSNTGLLVGNIMLLVISACCFCMLIPLVSVALSIVGIVYSNKIRHATSLAEERHYRNVAIIMLVLSIIFLALGVLVLSIGIYSEYGSLDAFMEAVRESANSK